MNSIFMPLILHFKRRLLEDQIYAYLLPNDLRPKYLYWFLFVTTVQ